MDTANAEPDGPQLGNVHERHIVWIIVAHLPRMSRHSFCSIFRRSALRCIRVRSYTVSFLMRSSELKSLHESRLARSSASLKRYRIGKQLEAPGSTRSRLTHLTHALSAHPERAPADWLDGRDCRRKCWRSHRFHSLGGYARPVSLHLRPVSNVSDRQQHHNDI